MSDLEDLFSLLLGNKKLETAGLRPSQAQRLGILSQLRLPSQVYNAYLTDALDEPLTFKNFLSNVGLMALQKLPEREQELQLLQSLKKMGANVSDAILGLPDDKRKTALDSIFKQQLEEELTALKPLFFNESELAEIAADLKIPFELLKQLVREEPEKFLTFLLKYREEKRKQIEEMLAPQIQPETIEQLAKQLNIPADLLAVLAKEDPKLILQTIREFQKESQKALPALDANTLSQLAEQLKVPQEILAIIAKDDPKTIFNTLIKIQQAKEEEARNFFDEQTVNTLSQQLGIPAELLKRVIEKNPIAIFNELRQIQEEQAKKSAELTIDPATLDQLSQELKIPKDILSLVASKNPQRIFDTLIKLQTEANKTQSPIDEVTINNLANQLQIPPEVVRLVLEKNPQKIYDTLIRSQQPETKPILSDRVLDQLSKELGIPKELLALLAEKSPQRIFDSLQKMKEKTTDTTTQESLALSPTLIESLANELGIPKEILEITLEKSPQRIFDALQNIRKGQTETQQQSQLIDAIPPEILEKFAQSMNTTPEALKQMLASSPELFKALAPKIFQLEKELIVEQTQQKGRVGQLKLKDALEQRDKLRTQLSGAEATLEIALNPMNQEILQKLPYRIMGIEDEDFSKLAQAININGNSLLEDRNKVIERIKSSKTASRNDLTRAIAHDIFERLVTNNPNKRISLAELYDYVQSVTQRFKKGFNLSDNPKDEVITSIANEYFIHLGEFYGSAFGNLAPREIVPRIKALFGDRDQALLGAILDAIASANFTQLQRAFEPMKGAISDREFQTLKRLTEMSAQSKESMMTAIFYGIYLAQKATNKLRNRVTELDKIIESYGE